ncbi:MAG: hypothetical protein GF364_12560 [Candidatus Lokiarchaeota archaeon]|nr:hypothetical protein [Candidatus Lokiarchaeota archaeon]
MLNKDRIGVLIGKNGETKELLETLTRTKIVIDSDTGEYTIMAVTEEDKLEGSTGKRNKIIESLQDSYKEEISLELNTEDPAFSVWITKKIIRAINMGFKPEKAVKLLDQNYILDVTNLESVIGHSEKKLRRIKGRIIGEKGKMRMSIEKFTNTHLSIYRNLIGIIGDYNSMKIAKKAVNMILDGLPHRVVYNFIQKKYREQKEKEFRETWKPTFD